TTTTEPTTTTTEPTTTTTQPTTTQPTTTQPTTTTTQPTTTTTTVAPTTTTDPDEPPLLGLLTPSKTSGLDTDAPRYTTPKPCNAGSDGYRMDIVGPGGFANGLNMTAVTDAGFSTTAPFEATQSLIFRDIAADAGTTIQPGRYTVVLSCVVQFEDRVTGFFGTVLDFTSPTAWHVVDGTNPTTPPTTPTTPPTTTSGPTSTTSGSTTADTTTTTDPGTGTVDPLPQGGTGGSGTGSAGSGSGGLASTGASVGLSVLVGVALVGFGTIAVIATRRRRAIPAPGEWPTES
ncbi:hypothetical protein, partial [Actinokineospora enzanensis]|uniref:hypothetical protein n=1 Tax=Actinokineospora enzanensis TaxID=155975 RepID=UPI0003644475